VYDFPFVRRFILGVLPSGFKIMLKICFPVHNVLGCMGGKKWAFIIDVQT
jgi:hypothetical protein